ncbi:TPA: alginate lyase family protein [Aeromonas veronii]
MKVKKLVFVFSLLCAAHNVFAFEHPGVLLNKTDIEFVRQKVSNEVEPWFSSYKNMLASPLANRSYLPTAKWDSMACGGPDGEGIAQRCKIEREDARAAYTQALAWLYSGDNVYAENSINIMNAWSEQFTGHHTGQNQALQASWAAAVWARAAEIIKHTYIIDGSSKWNSDKIKKFEHMLRSRYIDDINGQKTDCHFGNWQAVITEAKLNSAVFLDDQKLFDESLERFHKYFPTYVYLYSDGGLPKPIAGCYSHDELDKFNSYWSITNKTTPLKQGHAQETCRDLEHLAYGVAGFVNTAQTAYVQGVDLYSQEKERFISVMEFNAALDMAGNRDLLNECGMNVPVLGGLKGTMHIAYNHISKINGVYLPNTEKWLFENGSQRPQGFFHYLWEELTHTK